MWPEWLATVLPPYPSGREITKGTNGRDHSMAAAEQAPSRSAAMPQE
ncbi:hypothetical protein [Muricoccus radiodurans]